MTRRSNGQERTGRKPLQIPAHVADKLAHYVYVYVDPFDDRIFYVGKGKGRRALVHLDRALNPRTRREIRRTREKGEEPRIDVVVHGLSSSEEALRVEAAIIDAIGRAKLTNGARGWESTKRGRRAVEDLVVDYHRRRPKIQEPAILIKIQQSYRANMPAVELYDATRSVWRVGKRRHEVRYALAVFDQVVREVYEIERWFPAGRTFSTRGPRGLVARGRWEFVGRLAPAALRKRYIGAHVGQYFGRSQGPFTYAP